MKRNFLGIFAAALLTSGTVFAQGAESATPPPDGLDLVSPMIEAAQGGHWSIFVSLIIMALVWLATKAPGVKDFVKGEASIWIASVAGILSAVAVSAYTTGDWLRGIFDGLATGLAAGGLLELVSRKVSGKPIDANNDGKLDSLPPEAGK